MLVAGLEQDDGLVLQREMARILLNVPQEVVYGTRDLGGVGCAAPLGPTA